jgi:inosine/xanthosine triphosphate pyrophosphatase family protein
VAELDAATKNVHSHRARAMTLLVQQLREVWGL